MNETPSRMLLLVDDNVEAVTTLQSQLETQSIKDLDWRWCRNLKRLYEEIEALAKQDHCSCVVLLDSQISAIGVRDVLEGILSWHYPKLTDLIEESFFTGLLFSAVLKQVHPSCWIILHSAYAEQIETRLEAEAELASLAANCIDDWLWKPSKWDNCLKAILKGIDEVTQRTSHER